MANRLQKLKYELNMGAQDRKIRLNAGIALLLITIILGNIPLLALSGILIGTSWKGWCPVYSFMGKTTLKPGEAMDLPSHEQHG